MASFLGMGTEPAPAHWSPAYWELRLLDYDSGTLTVMDDSNVGPEGMKALAEAIACNPQYTPRGMRIGHGNRIGAEGMTTLAQILMPPHVADRGEASADSPGHWASRDPPSVRMLSIGQNEIGPEGAASIASALSVSTSITTLWLGSNNIGPEGAAALAEGLSMNRTLESLSLLDVSIGEGGERCMCTGIRDSHAILTSFGGTFPLNKYAESIFGLSPDYAVKNNLAILEAVGKKKMVWRRRLPALWLRSSAPDGSPRALVRAGQQNLMYRLPQDLSRAVISFL